MNSDTELLGQYAREGNEAAFTEVVRRYTDLVYSAALRMVNGDAHLARDVAQRVFLVLANKAGALSNRAGIVGWLYTTTRQCASVVVRGERRRRAREQIAFTMSEEPAGQEIDWSKLQPILDEEVCRLGQADRDAVLMRYFQGKSHREVGTVLGVSEDLARKRIERAIEKLRTSFSRRGLGVSSALLGEVIATHSVQAAPTGLAANLASSTLASAGPAGLVGSMGQGILIFMKTKIIAVIAVVILGLLIAGGWRWSQPASETQKNLLNPVAKSTPSVALPTGKVINATPTVVLPSGGSGNVSTPTIVVTSAAANATMVTADARAALNSTIQDVLKLVTAKDYATLALKYTPHKKRSDQEVLASADDPGQQGMFDTFADILKDVKNVEPVFGADGRRASLRSKPDSTALIFSRQDGSDVWQIAGIEYPQPAGNVPVAPAGQKKNADPNGGGYVP